MSDNVPTTTTSSGPSPSAFPVRAAIGGLLMGVANLVPGISGGTMLLAAGVYGEFIDAVADISRLRWRRASLLLVLLVGGTAALGIALLAGPVRDLVVHHRWIMYCLFVGLTIGGIPALWRLARPGSLPLWVGVAAGVGGMAALGIAQRSVAATSAAGGGFVPLVIAGAAGAASMILPGISGGYLLLVLGQYVHILTAIERGIDAVRSADLAGLADPVVGVFLPLGLGILIGVALISNLLRYLLHRHRSATLGVLLGLLAGVVAGLWPFQEAVEPPLGTSIQGVVVTPENLRHIDRSGWPVESFRPSSSQAAAGLLLVLSGTAVTLVVSRLGDS